MVAMGKNNLDGFVLQRCDCPVRFITPAVIKFIWVFGVDDDPYLPILQ